ncbi:hypothetical protein Pla86_42070 [Planctomycetes bacterium Pla86]|uniref:Uncharacterized protein n=1 Tax=Engelhardtia mirabilis TaxID=2528011 RepID=A0A518BQ44_9BACT|nr:hypothetical protein Pla133_42080 [Planctomycetes bacterium Pla133]QDV03419.1 hypothetical protein Pla86_42070 [Planctomycetes bacterium Pla86]
MGSGGQESTPGARGLLARPGRPWVPSNARPSRAGPGGRDEKLRFGPSEVSPNAFSPQEGRGPARGETSRTDTPTPEFRPRGALVAADRWGERIGGLATGSPVAPERSRSAYAGRDRSNCPEHRPPLQRSVLRHPSARRFDGGPLIWSASPTQIRGLLLAQRLAPLEQIGLRCYGPNGWCRWSKSGCGAMGRTAGAVGANRAAVRWAERLVPLEQIGLRCYGPNGWCRWSKSGCGALGPAVLWAQRLVPLEQSGCSGREGGAGGCGGAGRAGSVGVTRRPGASRRGRW